MKKRCKMLPSRICGGLLTGHVEYNKERFEKRKSRKLKTAYYAYITTTAIIILLCTFLLIFGNIGGGDMPAFNGAISQIAGFVIKNSFLDMSFLFDNSSISAGSLLNYTEGLLYSDKNGTVKPSVKPDDTETESTDGVSLDTIYNFDYSSVPSGYTPIIPMDLSLTSYGSAYIHNSTGLTPNTEMLLNMDFTDRIPLEYLSSSSPTVLIIHTHGTEAYSENGAISYLDDGGDIARSNDTQENVVAVGRALADALEKKGIKSVHCEIMHDENGYRNAYENAEETICSYLRQYPSLKLVIDLHRDSVVKSSGELVRPVTVADGKAAAQVMCVVGSSWGGEDNEKWETNLALALKLRRELNESTENLCRPVYLKESTYNQELAPYSLLLEVGASGNSIEEALASAELIADALANVIKEI